MAHYLNNEELESLDHDLIEVNGLQALKPYELEHFLWVWGKQKKSEL